MNRRTFVRWLGVAPVAVVVGAALPKQAEAIVVGGVDVQAKRVVVSHVVYWGQPDEVDWGIPQGQERW